MDADLSFAQAFDASLVAVQVVEDTNLSMILGSWPAAHFSWGRAKDERFAPASGRPVLSTLSVISVIDDDVSVRAATDNLLSSHGYEVRTFASAADFLRSSQTDESSCVVADVQMPGMNGLDLLEHVRIQGNDIPFIFITAFPDESVRARALKIGAICFLAKPFAAPVLIDCIETALHRHRGGAGK
jgi:CheY-like chemotaxis protein